MKAKKLIVFFTILLISCSMTEKKLIFKSGGQTAGLNKEHVVAAEFGKDVTGNTRVIITVNSDGLNIVNTFLSANLNKNMDILFGDNIISKSIPIRTDHFLKDIIIPFKNDSLAKEFYDEYSPAKL